ncbi:hypothetical protein V8G54_027959 [Vigna mungo]|uniref:Uncharacterized protein n=1 Tax=Vigna mungo TaxID=3915 RepID=A0AAQ3RHR1_VIGMU
MVSPCNTFWEEKNPVTCTHTLTAHAAHVQQLFQLPTSSPTRFPSLFGQHTRNPCSSGARLQLTTLVPCPMHIQELHSSSFSMLQQGRPTTFTLDSNTPTHIHPTELSHVDFLTWRKEEINEASPSFKRASNMRCLD